MVVRVGYSGTAEERTRRRDTAATAPDPALGGQAPGLARHLVARRVDDGAATAGEWQLAAQADGLAVIEDTGPRP